jgi:hypothetical protein
VPAGAEIDGASIPKVFWSIVGGPYTGLYRNASVIHDYYCDVRTRPWKEVHRMFYDAMLASGVDKMKAKLMYLAVRFGGPRWDDQTIHNNVLPPAYAAPTMMASANNQYAMSVNGEGPPRYNWVAPPNPEDRLMEMAEQVEQGDLSLDEIDQLADHDTQNRFGLVPMLDR